MTPAGRPLLETGGEVKGLAFSPDGRTLAGVTSSGMATLGYGVTIAPAPTIRYWLVFAGGVSLSADGTTLATAGSSG